MFCHFNMFCFLAGFLHQRNSKSTFEDVLNMFSQTANYVNVLTLGV